MVEFEIFIYFYPNHQAKSSYSLKPLIMSNTYTQLNIHAVFSVKGRENLLSGTIRNELFPYIAGIVKNTGNFPLVINGYKDHVHLFFELNPSISVSEVIESEK